jgi:hypothetical protein
MYLPAENNGAFCRENHDYLHRQKTVKLFTYSLLISRLGMLSLIISKNHISDPDQ